MLSSFQTNFRVFLNREEVEKEEIKWGCSTCSFSPISTQISLILHNLHKFC